VDELLADWRFLVFAGTMIFNIGAIWAQWQGSRVAFRDLKTDVKDLKEKVLNGITCKLSEHTDRLTRIEARCEARHKIRRWDDHGHILDSE